MSDSALWSDLSVGDQVLLHGLQSSRGSQLNGCIGITQGIRDGGRRFAVSLSKNDRTQDIVEPISIAAENLVLMESHFRKVSRVLASVPGFSVRAICSILRFVFPPEHIDVSLEIMDAIFRCPPHRLRQAPGVAKDLFQLLCDSWDAPVQVESKAGSRRFPPLEDGCAGMNGLMKRFQRMLTWDRHPQTAKPIAFQICGSVVRGTALREGSDLDVMFIFDCPPEEFEQESFERKYVANVLYHAHRSLSRAVRSCDARSGGAIFQYYLREGSDIRGCGSRVSYRGWQVDCIVVLNNLSIPRIQRLTSFRHRTDLSAEERQLCSTLLHKLQPTILFTHYRQNRPPALGPTTAAAARIVKLWWRICAEMFSDSEEMTQSWRAVWSGATDMNEDLFPDDIRNKTQTGLGGVELESVVLEAGRVLLAQLSSLSGVEKASSSSQRFILTVDALVVHTWRLLASGWAPSTLDRMGTTKVGVSLNRLFHVVKEQLMARATLAMYSRCVEVMNEGMSNFQKKMSNDVVVRDDFGFEVDIVITRRTSVILPALMGVALLKHADFDAAQASIAFDSDILAKDVDAAWEEIECTSLPGNTWLNKKANALETGRRMRKSRKRYALLLVQMEMTFEVQFWSGRHEISLLGKIRSLAQKAIALVREKHMSDHSMIWPKMLDELRRGDDVGTILRPRRVRARKRNELGDGGFVIRGLQSLTIIAQRQTAAFSFGQPFSSDHANGRRWPDREHYSFDPLGESFYQTLIRSTLPLATNNIGERGIFILQPWQVFSVCRRLGDPPQSGTLGDMVLPRGVCRCKPGAGCKNTRYIYPEGGGIHTIDGAFFLCHTVVTSVFNDSCYRFPSAATFDAEFIDKVCFKKRISRSLPESCWGFFSGCQPLVHQTGKTIPPPCVCVACRQEWIEIFSKPVPSNLQPRTAGLIRELRQMSSSDTSHAFSEFRSVFLDDKTETRTKEIGQELHDIGGIELMRQVFPAIPNYDHDNLSMAFHLIGDWLH